MCENLVLLFNVLGLVRTPRNGAILDSNPRSDHKKQFLSLVARVSILSHVMNNQRVAPFSLVIHHMAEN